jgi:hypothetical protein
VFSRFESDQEGSSKAPGESPDERHSIGRGEGADSMSFVGVRRTASGPAHRTFRIPNGRFLVQRLRHRVAYRLREDEGTAVIATET